MFTVGKGKGGKRDREFEMGREKRGTRDSEGDGDREVILSSGRSLPDGVHCRSPDL